MTRRTDTDPHKEIRHQLEAGRVSCLFWSCIVGALVVVAVMALWPWS